MFWTKFLFLFFEFFSKVALSQPHQLRVSLHIPAIPTVLEGIEN